MPEARLARVEILIGAHQLEKSFSSQQLFRALTFSISEGERVGLIGPNGAGKSTLLKILAGQTDLDGGRLALKRGLRVGYLEQNPVFDTQKTIEDILFEKSAHRDDWQVQAKMAEVRAKLGLTEFALETVAATLSGGWRRRLALARELMGDPELLLLDEPTNHLDVESILWLEGFLARAPFATLTITHDRLFLQKVANRIIELNPRFPEGLLSVSGSYSDYLRIRSEQLNAQEAREAKLKNTLRRELEWLSRGPQARLTKQSARIQSAHELKGSVADLSARNKSSLVRLDFQSTEKTPKKLIEAKGISKSFNGMPVIPNLDLVISARTRLALMGPNGCGKSTLIKILTGDLEPDSGQVRFAEALELSYFEQNRESLDPKQTVTQTVCPMGEYVDFAGQFVHVRGYLSRFLFSFDQMEREVGKLSGGEQSRLLLARLMLKKANLLVLDEPTNDLDMATLDVLSEVLAEFPGAILIVTHDRYFMDQVSNEILAFGHGEAGEPILQRLVGLEQWQTWHDEQITREARSTTQAPTTAVAKKVKLTYKEQREFDGIEQVIVEAEAKMTDLSVKLEKSATLSTAEVGSISIQLSEVQQNIERLYARWSELSEKQNGKG